MSMNGLRARLLNRLRGQIAWLTDERRDLNGLPTNRACVISIVGREHYIERRRTYPIRSKRDLSAVLRQELANAPLTLTSIAPEHDDCRRVTFFELREGVAQRLGRTVWMIPESLVVAAAMHQDSIACVERYGFRYLLAASGLSLPAGGEVSDLERFGVAIGSEPDGARLSLDAVTCSEHLRRGLKRLAIDDWRTFMLPRGGSRLPIDLRRPLIVAGAIVLAYMTLASAYLHFLERRSERDLRALGPEVEGLLRAQRLVSELSAEQNGIQKVLRQRTYGYCLWQVAAEAWRKGALIQGVSLQDGALTIRGVAPAATEVLAAVRSVKGSQGARFSAPVRAGQGGGEDFVITLVLVGSDRGG